MKNELIELKNKLNAENEEQLTDSEIAYLEQIEEKSDLQNYSDSGNGAMNALAYDAAIAIGCSKREADEASRDVMSDEAEKELSQKSDTVIFANGQLENARQTVIEHPHSENARDEFEQCEADYNDAVSELAEFKNQYHI